MIRITLSETPAGLELLAIGHAGLAPRGADPVCAGVSALLFGYLARLERLALEAGTKEAFVRSNVGPGCLMVWSGGLGGRDRASLAVIAEGLFLIAAAHPEALWLAGFEGFSSAPAAALPRREHDRKGGTPT